MKKTLLASILCLFLLVGCNNPSLSTSHSNLPYGEGVSTPEFVVAIEEVHNKLNQIVEPALDNVKGNQVLTDSINAFKAQEEEYIASIEDVYEAIDALDYIDGHQDEYCEYTFRSEVLEQVYSDVYTMILEVEDLAVRRETNMRFDDMMYRFDSIWNSFDALTGFFKNTKDSIEEYIYRATGDHPGREETELEKKVKEFINDIRDFTNDVVYQAHDWVDDELIWQRFDDKIKDIRLATSIEQAQALVKPIKDDIYGYALNLYKEALVDDYLGFVAWVEKVVANEDIKRESIGFPEDNVNAIRSQSSFEVAYKDYYANIDDINFWIITYYVRNGVGQLDNIYLANNTKFTGEAATNFKAKYDECVSRMWSVHCDLDELDDTVNGIINEFKDYLAQLLK